MVSRISRIFILFLLIFFFFSCSSGGNAHDAGSDGNGMSQDVPDDSEHSPDDDAPVTADSEPDEDSASPIEEEPAPDEDTDTDTELFHDEESAPDEDHALPADEDDVFENEDEDGGQSGEFEDFDGETVQIRIVAGNITSGNNQSYDPGHGIRIFQALKPDIALVQEMNYKNNSAGDYKNFAQQIVGTSYYAVDDADYQIPNGIVSRYPITSHGYWKDPNITNRALMWAVVDIPGEKDIFAISVHLHTSPASDQTAAALVIVNEVAKLKSSNPDKYYYVVGGDFNGPTAVSSGGFGKNNTFYVSGPHPVDDNGDEETNANGSKQYDFVLADYPLHDFQIPVVFYSSKDEVKTKTYKNGLVFDTRVYDQSVLDEYFSPAQKSDSSASQMQHMAIVKDFVIDVK